MRPEPRQRDRDFGLFRDRPGHLDHRRETVSVAAAMVRGRSGSLRPNMVARRFGPRTQVYWPTGCSRSNRMETDIPIPRSPHRKSLVMISLHREGMGWRIRGCGGGVVRGDRKCGESAGGLGVCAWLSRAREARSPTDRAVGSPLPFTGEGDRRSRWRGGRLHNGRAATGRRGNMNSGPHHRSTSADLQARIGAARSVRVAAPSTMLRMVPLPRFAGEDAD